MMSPEYEAQLWINNNQIDMNEFVEAFLAKTVAGMASALRGAGEIKTLEVYFRAGEVKIVLNERNIPLTLFPNDIIASTLSGMVSPLRGGGDVEELRISIRAK